MYIQTDSPLKQTKRSNRMEGNESSTEDVETSPSSIDSILHVGDRVCVYLPAVDLKQVQRGRGGWSMRMTEVCKGNSCVVSLLYYKHVHLIGQMSQLHHHL